MGRTGSILLLAGALAVGLVLWEGFSDGGATPPASVPENSPAAPTLEGRAPPPAAEPFAGVTDLGELVRGGSPAAARLVELAHGRPETARALAAWLAPEHDKDRVPARLAQTGYNAQAMAACLCETLGRLGPEGIAALADLLSSDDALLRRRVAHCLERLGEKAAAAVPALLLRLAPDAEDIHGKAAMLRALGAMGPAARDALPRFHEILRDPNAPDEVQEAAAEGLIAIGGFTQDVRETIRRVLREGSYAVDMSLVPALASRGKDAAPLVPDLLLLIDGERTDVRVRWAAIADLGRIGVADAKVVGLLLDLVTDERKEDRTRSSAARSLVRLGAKPTKELLGWLAGADDDTRLLVVPALSFDDRPPWLDPDRLLAVLDPLRLSEWPEDHTAAIRAGRDVAGDSPALVPWLVRWLGAGDADTRLDTVWALSTLDGGGADERVLSAVGGVLGDPDASVRRAALCTVRQWAEEHMGDEGPLASPALVERVRKRLGDPDAWTREEAAFFLHRVAPEHDQEALPVWIRIVERGPWQPEVYEVLQGLGPRARSAIPALEKALPLVERFPSLHERVQRTLAAIRGS